MPSNSKSRRSYGAATARSSAAVASALASFVTVLALTVVVPAASASADDGPALDVAYHDDAARIIGAALTSDHGSLRLSELCDGIGHRLSGSPELERAVLWAAAAMREDGLEGVRLQPALVPHWVRGEESATMVEPGPEKLSILGLGRSVGTPKGGITAEVVVVGSYTELDALPAAAVRGKMVLYDVPFTHYGETVRYRGTGAIRASARGAVAALVRSVGPVSLRTPHTGAMHTYVDSFPEIPAAAVTIEDAKMIHRLVARGQKVRVHLEMGAQSLDSTLSHNVIGEIRGRELPDEVVVVGGHIDSWDVGQGAHDDGGGCVASMEALRIIHQLGLRPRRTLRCVLWTNEENGIRGAHAYRDSLGRAVEKHVAAVEIDGGVERPIGFGVRVDLAGTDSIDVARTKIARERVERIAPLLAGLDADTVDDHGGGADISPLMKEGIPGLAHRTVGEHYFDWHHTQADMLDKIDPVEFRKNVAVLAVMVYVLADMPETLLDRDPPASTTPVHATH